MTDALREQFEAYFLNSRRGKGAAKAPAFARLADGTYADDPTQRHWWTWQNALRAAIAAPRAAAPKKPAFMFQIGEEYETQAGKMVRVLDRTTTAGYECLQCSDGKYRYDRSNHSDDAGRVTGTDHDYSWPGNFRRADKPRAAAPTAPEPGEALR